MGYQSKTYSLSDEVVAAIEAARSLGQTPNQFFTQLIRDAKLQQREAAARTWDGDDDEDRQKSKFPVEADRR